MLIQDIKPRSTRTKRSRAKLRLSGRTITIVST